MSARPRRRRRGATRAFTLVEVLVAAAVAATLVAILAPALAGARDSARRAACGSNLRQLALGWQLYAGDFDGHAMPLGDERAQGGIAYWFGLVPHDGGPTRHDGGFMAPFLDATLAAGSVYECPSQAWGTYRPQPRSIPPPGAPTTTYGYNGYYLCPPMTPGWNRVIGAQPWKRVERIERASDVLVFADALLPVRPVMNTALLDPPMLYSGEGRWRVNGSPTTAFRHARAAAAVHADGSAVWHAARPSWLTHADLGVGSVGTTNGPHYVPDWTRWR